ncbi:MAG: HAD-IIB family hydrolase [Oceanococcaceae bacterium]
MMRPAAVVVTDLDGCLLDAIDYGWQPAQPALALLREQQIPLVLNTSKTWAEVRPLQRALEIPTGTAVVVENGGAVHLHDRQHPLGVPRETLGDWLTDHDCARRYRFQSFTELGVRGIARATGLSLGAAARAAERCWTEPLLWEDSADARERFTAEARAAGLQVLAGGRFLHLQGPVDKGDALPVLRAIFAVDGDDAPPIVALGDAENDRAMLAAADVAIWVRSPRHPVPAGVPRARVSIDTGPLGWNQSLQQWLQESVSAEEPR